MICPCTFLCLRKKSFKEVEILSLTKRGCHSIVENKSKNHTVKKLYDVREVHLIIKDYIPKIKYDFQMSVPR